MIGRLEEAFLQCVFSDEKKEVEERWVDRKEGRGDVLGRCSGADEGHR